MCVEKVDGAWEVCVCGWAWRASGWSAGERAVVIVKRADARLKKWKRAGRERWWLW